MFYIYVHTVPNGKMYVGQTKDIVSRWYNGEGYVNNREFYKDIQIYKWNNIKHEIIAQVEDRETALRLEAVLIALLKTEDTNYGYNQTSIYKDAMKKFTTRIPVDGVDLESNIGEDSFFEASNLPISVCQDLINQWIFNKSHREILKSRLIDGISYTELSKIYGKSVRQLKNIVYYGCSKIEKHF